MRRSVAHNALAMGALVVVVSVASVVTSCGKPIGSEGGPCTGGGGCDVGLVCLSDVCVDPNSGEGEGEGGEGEGEGGEGEGEGGCQGDNAAQNERADCLTIPTAVCADAEENGAVQTCDLAAAILRSGIFQAAYDCIEAIPANACATLDAEVDECFGLLTACPLPAADSVCEQAVGFCEQEGDFDFPLDACIADLRATNQAFRDAYAACFNGSVDPCNVVHDNCYNTALNTLVSGG